jgi:hypothetical protein
MTGSFCCWKSLSLSKTLEHTRPSLPCALYYLRALWPRDGKDNDALVVEVGEGETGIAKKRVFSIRRSFLRIFFGYPGG